MMPVMSGREFLSVLRADDVLAPIPVVVVSAWPSEAHATPGVQGFVKKPVDSGAAARPRPPLLLAVRPQNGMGITLRAASTTICRGTNPPSLIG